MADTREWAARSREGREMLIQLNDKYRATGIKMNFVLEEKKIRGDKSKEAGQEYWGESGYYSNLEQLLNALLIRQLQDTGTEGIRDLIDELRVSTGIMLEQIKLLKCENCGGKYEKSKSVVGNCASDVTRNPIESVQPEND
jgi:hypothetical protein